MVIPTHNRPELVRAAIASVLGQDYAGTIEIVVVFDRSEPDHTLARQGDDRAVRVIHNVRTPGLAGSRNSGILSARADIVAFCDDDDQWLPLKLSRQVSLLQTSPDCEMTSTSIVIDFEGRSIVRLAGQDRVTYAELLRSRKSMLHSSGFVFRRDALIEGIGLIDEDTPRSMAEDWDILLRAARRRPILHIDEPLVRVRWGPTSFFANDWQVRNEARLWMLAHHPDIARDRKGFGLTHGKLAFGHAMLGQRRQAVREALLAASRNPLEPRLYLALLVAARVLPGQRVVNALNRRGHGI
ncbi:glycosyltransferase family 2 protein [Nocardioides mangrovicus]|uniref:glycosyltransferase family 2 protein n=1 Tax=Nocardioides mangrovicus TaxID=2478913 RepID=UPI0018E08C39|nr:glycosyltransferase family 2 protein [Nocardioides mangrovicus]